MLKRFFRWLFRRDEYSKLNRLAIDLEHALETTRLQIGELRTLRELPPPRQFIYVTLRGYYHLDQTIMANVGLPPVPHGWTQKVSVAEGEEKTVEFHPYSPFTTERVDVLGPADIVGAKVGNECVSSPQFSEPASFENGDVMSVTACESS